MFWSVFQISIVLLAIISDLHWRWAPHGVIPLVLGFALAFLSSWLLSMLIHGRGTYSPPEEMFDAMVPFGIPDPPDKSAHLYRAEAWLWHAGTKWRGYSARRNRELAQMLYRRVCSSRLYSRLPKNLIAQTQRSRGEQHALSHQMLPPRPRRQRSA